MNYTKIFFLILVIMTGLFFHAGRAGAVLTKQLSYQGRLQDASGNPVANGTYSVTFSIYNVSSGGSALYTETQNVTVDKGGFSAYIGSVTPLNLPFNEDYFLGIKVGSDPEMTPRLKLSVVGTAVFAMDAGSLGGQPSSNYALTSHTHTVGSSEITDGSVNASDINQTTVQSRVTGTCAGQVMVAINQDGTVTCEADDSGGGGGTPAISVTSVGASAVVGTSTNYAREDHVHNVPAGFITDAMVNASAAIAKSKLNLSNSILFSDIAQNGCASGQVVEWNGSAWNCGTDDTGAGGIVTNPASTQTIIAGNSSTTPLILKGAAGTTVPMFEVQDSAGARKFAVMSDGHVFVPSGNQFHVLGIDNDSPTGPMGNITVDVINASADSKLVVTNSNPSFKAGIDVEGSVLAGNPAWTTAKVSAEETGTANVAGYFKINNASNANSAVRGVMTGTGEAGLFQIVNASNSSPAVSGTTTGTGNAVYGFTNGTGTAGQFVVSNGSNSASVLLGNTTGTGNLLQLQKSGVDKFIVDNTGNITVGGAANAVKTNPSSAQTIAPTADATALVLKPGTGAPTVDIFGINNFADSNLLKVTPTGKLFVGNPTLTTAKVSVYETGTADKAGYFEINNASNASVALYGFTSGTGKAGYFEILNASNSDVAFTGTTNGTGNAGSFTISNGGSSASVIIAGTSGTGNLLQLQQGAVDKFIVNNAGVITTASVGSAAIVDGTVAVADLVTGSVVLTSPGVGQMLQPTADVVPLFIRDDAATTAALFDVQSNAGISHVKVTGTGNLFVGNPSATTAKVSVEESGGGNNAGYFRILNAVNGAQALYATTNGNGDGRVF